MGLVSGGSDNGAVTDPGELLSPEEKQRLADLRDSDANRRDRDAEGRDRDAEKRDRHSNARDEPFSDEPGLMESRRRAAEDRDSAARDRAAGDYDRERSRRDRHASAWDRSVARQVETQLWQALSDADDLAEATFAIGQAQGALSTVLQLDATEALIELGDRASRDQVGLQEAARRILAEIRQ